MIIGLTGRIAGGKGVASDFFRAKGFEYLSLSNEVREEANKRGLPLERKSLQDLGNLMRKEEGSSVLAKRVIKKIKKKKNYVIDGIRNSGEVEELRKVFKNKFILISIDADLRIRWKNAKNRAKESDPKTFKEFLKADKRDFKENSQNGQQVKKCMEMADYALLNNGTIQELIAQLKLVYRQLNLDD
ncbi:MAG TPA: AAA family ATPase [Candidatus Pacearchaeota archaeon]|nr:AAA family ATPase [Candidatus Pacearchaeota archaeon]HQF82997.1 AAA family ATPase [Candidatus Pacearchaeota archaeon]HQI57974.1 AAA family ATPase [Candidatus Pacearchaeota archaeon]HQJ57921.1 AAA family ATPase [Candidatus Pacearchaeota archaeon]